MQKTDKKIIIMLAVILIAVLSAGFFVFKYLKEIRTAPQDSVLQENLVEEQTGKDSEFLEDQEQPSQEQMLEDTGLPEIEFGPVQGLSICKDKCGDAICQLSDLECQDNINCACPETKEECPQDCK